MLRDISLTDLCTTQEEDLSHKPFVHFLNWSKGNHCLLNNKGVDHFDG